MPAMDILKVKIQMLQSPTMVNEQPIEKGRESGSVNPLMYYTIKKTVSPYTGSLLGESAIP